MAKVELKEDLTDEEFYKKYANVLYKTETTKVGVLATEVKAEEPKGLDGRFTDHLLHAGMYRNHSLNTVPDKERVVERSKDWMDHLN